MITSAEIKQRLWNGANELRGSMDASRYKDYMLGLMFYKFLSDKTLEAYATMAELETTDTMELLDNYTEAYEKYGEDLESYLQTVLGYYVQPEYLYHQWIKDINEGEFEVQKVIDSLNNFERTVQTSEGGDDFRGLFSSSTIDFTDTALGSNLNTRSKNIKSLILLFADLNMVELQEGDVLGDAYEYLIGMFAMESGKKAGEFYTPRQVSEVMAQIVTQDKNIKSVYDPTVGSGSLLLTVGGYLSEERQKNLNYFGQEKNTATYNLARMNLLLHGVRPERMVINNGDTLEEDWPEDPARPNEAVQFDAVVMNPPYSLKNWNKAGLKVSDPRFEIAGVLPPNSKGDYAFLLHGLYHLNTTGTMAIVLPHGVLFRGGTEGEIRQKLLEKNYIDTIVGLPASLFTNTGIPVIVMILKKNRDIDAPVLIIDASKDFVKVGKQNQLQDKDIARIVDTYVSRQEIKGYSQLADRQEIKANEYNLNIPRYVTPIDEDFAQDVDAHRYGGIPVKNIEELTVLQKVAGDVLNQALKPVREGYVSIEWSKEKLTEEILNASAVREKVSLVKQNTDNYLSKYWGILKSVDAISEVKIIQESMLNDIKDILQELNFVDQYEGYQIIANLWNAYLKQDAEIIAVDNFYELGRKREKNMVTKGSGSKKRQEQDGWKGVLVPNDLIADTLYQDEQNDIESLKDNLAEVEQSLFDLVESAKEEDTPEYDALYDVIKKNADDEPQDSFDNKLVKQALKEIDESNESFEYLEKVTDLTSHKTKANRDIKDAENELKELVEGRISDLTNKEIDELVYKKWFGTTKQDFVDLVEAPLLKELEILDNLNKRYSKTLTDIDNEIEEATKDFESLLNDLVMS